MNTRGTLLWVGVASLALAACGGSKEPPKEAENTDETGDAAALQDMPPTDTSVDGGAGGTAGGDAKPSASPCLGFELDLSKALNQAACEVPSAAASAKSRDMKGILEVKLSLSTPKISPGNHVDITVTFANKSKADLPLDFVVDPEPHFEVQVYDKAGRRVDSPAGPEPRLPPEVTSAPVPEKHTARATIVQLGNGRITIGWDAVKQKWAPKERAKGAIPGRGYPTVPGPPLPKGKYTLRVVTPLTGVFEGIDHEMSQPRLQIEITP